MHSRRRRRCFHQRGTGAEAPVSIAFKARLFLALPVFLAVLLLPGCGDSYSEAIKYAMRIDPIVMDAAQLGPERYEPERPGQLPLFSVKDLLDIRNPLHDRREVVLNQEKLRDPALIKTEDRQKMREALDELFGTPAKPTVKGISEEAKKVLGLDDATLEKGSRLYRIHCIHCHGVNGDGRGPTAKWIHPHPRDFRQGLFKFISSDQRGLDRPPRREDLFRTLKTGIEGTAMPTFNLLGDEALNQLVSYVMHLSIRGKAEFETVKYRFDPDPKDKTLVAHADLKQELVDRVPSLCEEWAAAQGKLIPVVPTNIKETNIKEMTESVRRGQALFLADEKLLKEYFPKDDIGSLKGASCVTCHKDYGRQATWRFDNWGTLVRPTNLTVGVYRGGRRPLDLYYRIHAGIPGSGMVSFGGTLADEKSADKIWNLIHFLEAMPYPAMREKYGISLN